MQGLFFTPKLMAKLMEKNMKNRMRSSTSAMIVFKLSMGTTRDTDSFFEVGQEIFSRDEVLDVVFFATVASRGVWNDPTIFFPREHNR